MDNPIQTGPETDNNQDTQNRTLAELEDIIKRGKLTLLEVGEALTEIHDRKLYKQAGFKKFSDYLAERWQISRAHGYRALAAAKQAKTEMSPNETKPSKPKAKRKQPMVTDEEFEKWRNTVLLWQAEFGQEEFLNLAVKAKEWLTEFLAGNYAYSAPDDGWLLCDGTIYFISKYPRLAARIGNQYGGDGSITFAVPDMRGSVPIGSGTGSGLTTRNLGDSGGEETHQLITAEIPSHMHNVYFQANAASGVTGSGVSGSGTFAGGNTTFTGGGGAHNNMQPFLCINFFIST
jgi:microcystin-dependent protein